MCDTRPALSERKTHKSTLILKTILRQEGGGGRQGVKGGGGRQGVK